MTKRAIKDAIPVMMGYFPIAMTFGILAKTAGVVLIDGVLMSAMVYAGASQFMAVSMIAAGISPMSIVAATFLMNFRHFIMSASIRAKVESVHSRWYPVIGFFLTDETFSVASMKESIDDAAYLVPLELSCYSAWVTGTLAGYLTGMFFPKILIEAMGIALYALFVALLIPACKKSPSALWIAVVAGATNTVMAHSGLVGTSGSFAITVIVVSLLAALRSPVEKEEAINES